MQVGKKFSNIVKNYKLSGNVSKLYDKSLARFVYMLDGKSNSKITLPR